MAQEKTSKKKTNKVSDAKRHGIQALWAFLTNSHVSGFVTGKIYTGKLKNVCVPGLNCYSCPGAVGACPIGYWLFDFYWSHFWKTDLWLFMSIWTDTGSVK